MQPYAMVSSLFKNKVSQAQRLTLSEKTLKEITPDGKRITTLITNEKLLDIDTPAKPDVSYVRIAHDFDLEYYRKVAERYNAPGVQSHLREKLY